MNRKYFVENLKEMLENIINNQGLSNDVKINRVRYDKSTDFALIRYEGSTRIGEKLVDLSNIVPKFVNITELDTELQINSYLAMKYFRDKRVLKSPFVEEWRFR